MNKFAIQGHCTRGREVIAVLESAGGKNHNNLKGSAQFDYYWINPEDNTININSMQFIKSHYGVNEFYTLEEFILEESNSSEKECENITEALNFCQTLKELPVDVYYTSPIKQDIAQLPTLSTCETEDVSIGFVKEDKGRTRLVIPEGYELKTDGNNTYLVKIKPIYPKTYDECCAILGHEVGRVISFDTQTCKTDTLFENFYKLYVCRNAYWKIYGEQTGLNKPWEPDWKDNRNKYFICYFKDELWMSNIIDCNRLLVFPTEEMRDTFYDNFKELIENCKELL